MGCVIAALPAWPRFQKREWSGRGDSNSRPTAPKAVALARLRYAPIGKERNTKYKSGEAESNQAGGQPRKIAPETRNSQSEIRTTMNTEFEDELRKILADVAVMHMPFGKFGPGKFPPDGVPLYDLPYEYLAYFERKGYPRGKLGRLMKFVHDIKKDGAEAIFNPVREARGGRTSLRKSRRRHIDFDE